MTGSPRATTAPGADHDLPSVGGSLRIPEDPQGPQDLVELEGQWFVRTRSALADDRTHVLKDGETFAVFDRYGDIQPVGLGEQGLYHEGTRHLSHFDLRIAHKRPLLLSSDVSTDDAMLIVDLANPEYLVGNGDTVPAETVHVFRRVFLWQGICHQRIEARNYGQHRIPVSLSVRFEADFRDLFEVRGSERPNRGRLMPLEQRRSGAVLAYEGLDGVTRKSVFAWSGRPVSRAGQSAVFEFELAPGETRSLDIRVECASPRQSVPRHGAPSSQRTLRARRYDVALHSLEEQRAEALRQGCAIRTSDNDVNAWLRRSRTDMVMLETQSSLGSFPYAGIPWFSTPFGRDGIIAALEMLWVRPALAAGVLRYLAATQAREVDPARDAEPGKILHESRLGEMAALREVPFGRYYGSVDATPLYLILAAAYFETTGDLGLITELWPSILAGLEWLHGAGDSNGDGFVDYVSNPDALTNQGWKDSSTSVFHADGSLAEGAIALCEVQAYTYAAFRGVASLSANLGQNELAISLREAAAQLRDRFEDAFWIEELGTYAIALDGKGVPCAVTTSNAGHALFGEIADPARAARVARMLMSDRMYSGWGVRTLSSDSPRFNPMSYHNGSVWPHDNAMIADGLSRYGYKEEALRMFEGMLAASRRMPHTRMPELFCGFPRREQGGPTSYPVANSPQAWAAGAPFLLLRACLGLSVDGVRNEVRLDRPVLPQGLDHVRLERLAVGSLEVDLELHRYPEGVAAVATRRTGDVRVISVK
ncbi:MAG: amylo-alpha-1,6-glucosidase [Dehalococcoidia bacterium]